jgi:hypothetical protein
MKTPRTREKPTQRRGIFKKKMYMESPAGSMPSMYNYFSWSVSASILNCVYRISVKNCNRNDLRKYLGTYFRIVIIDF